tara:strand:- start:2044 stop:2568 length:525 start_codon:yes stop_codon:yes gene_type:complete
MKNYNKLIIFLSIFIFGFLIAIIILSWPLLTGKTHVLATQPIDPFDVLRGQYIVISYEISRVSDIEGISEDNVGDYIYITLEKDEQGISRIKYASLQGSIDEDFIRGRIKSVSRDIALVEYGIEQFFFERGGSFSMRGITVEVRISKSGQARISKLLQNGEPLDIKYKDVGFAS